MLSAFGQPYFCCHRTSSMDVFVLITKYILGCYNNLTVSGIFFHYDNFYKITLYFFSRNFILVFLWSKSCPLYLYLNQMKQFSQNKLQLNNEYQFRISLKTTMKMLGCNVPCLCSNAQSKKFVICHQNPPEKIFLFKQME